MPQLYTDLGPMLLHYKNTNALGRQGIMHDIEASVKKLSKTIFNKDQAKAHYKTLSYAATLINYADVLRRMENQQYFDILFDFYNMEMDEELSFWFEFGKIPGQMRLKYPIHEYTSRIWEKFRTAQKAHLTKTSKTHLFNLDELDITHPPKEQLYPIQIQMGGQLKNEAVDRVYVDSHGLIRFARRYGFYVLPGGGMIEITNPAKIDDLLRKMLEEHLEEEHANLYIKAAVFYDQLPKEDFNAVLRKLAVSKQAQFLPEELQHWLQGQAIANENNSVRLQKIVTKLNQQIEKVKGIKCPFFELKAMAQVQPFTLTPLFSEAFAYIKANTICVDIQQYLDTRVLGGSQMSHSFIMTGQPLEDWFKAKFHGVDGEFGDDLAGFKTERLNLLEALANFRKVRFSHVLIGLAAYEQCLDNGTLYVKNIWNDEQFEHARAVILEATGIRP